MMLNVELTQDDIIRAQRRIEDEQKRIKIAFKWIKTLSYEGFRKHMNSLHSNAYMLAIDEMKQAMSCVLTKKQMQQVEEQFKIIRADWDQIEEITVDYSEFDLYDFMEVVTKEMKRAARLHGEAFKDLQEAREAIIEEHEEVWQAVDEGDLLHAKIEAIQLIGTLVKFIRTVK